VDKPTDEGNPEAVKEESHQDLPDIESILISISKSLKIRHAVRIFSPPFLQRPFGEKLSSLRREISPAKAGLFKQAHICSTFAEFGTDISIEPSGTGAHYEGSRVYYPR